MLLGSNVLPLGKDEFLKNLAELASDKKTLIFLDTNILAYLYKLHSAARQEFFTWADAAIVDRRLYVPGWCAGEYLARLRKDQLLSYTPRTKEESQIRKSLEVMLDTASLFVDDNVLQKRQIQQDRATFLAEFRNSIDGLKPFLSVFAHQFDADAIHDEIQTHFGSVVLDSPLAELCERAAREGPARIAHRLPPGYKDDDKSENSLGDLIIWFELLRYSRQRKDEFQNVLFLTNDEKPDWVYAPLRRVELIGNQKKKIPNDNPRLYISDPRLVAEFCRNVGHDRITICSLSAIVEGISKISPTGIGQLAAAIQIDLGARDNSDSPAAAQLPDNQRLAELSVEGPDQLDDISPGEEEDIPIDQGPASHTLEFEEEGYRDNAYESDKKGEINEIIDALRSHNWYVQNPAIDRIRSIREHQFLPTEWFVLGRNIYQAACGNAQKAMSFMANLDIQLKRFRDDVAEYLLAGMVFEIYFDNRGKLRTRPKAGYLDDVTALLVGSNYARVREFINSKLDESHANLAYRPGADSRYAIVVESSAAEGQDESARLADEVRLVTSVKLNGIELLSGIDPKEEVSAWSSPTRSYSAGELVERIAAALSIPKWSIDLNSSAEGDLSYKVPDGKKLRPEQALPSEDGQH